MSQIDKMVKVLAKNNKGSGITVAKIAKLARMPRENVAKRVYDLRAEGFQIYSNYRKVNGKRKLYYRMAS
jgi:biotin operon repressor